ncbi:hypothetical protein COB21_04940 [Candidatus Aerophobetes bacterium]|uniref:6-hydroxymethylpterin diphosphokinase MptE-like domain-containing protein n=1 Tax=Aerophobetes bacterium TaxID=2030807 RepID=A0A2A4X083_UNCAE|nr:MAG: hypothetical protein COB21_04940 [Candidatus Aerophobetes bacterium]
MFSVGDKLEKTNSLFAQRYPGLAFLINMEERECSEYVDEKEAAIALAKQYCPKDADIIYVFGLHVSDCFYAYKSWLEANDMRHLVFLDFDMSAIHGFLSTSAALDILNHPRVHIRVPLSPDRIEEVVCECAQTFPIEKVLFAPSQRYVEKHKELVEKLTSLVYAQTTQQHALLQEGVYYHLFFRNFLKNIEFQQNAFIANKLKGRFDGVPAIICGAGPSLEKDLSALKKLYSKALIISAGSAITALSRSQTKFHMAIALDPNDEEVRRFKENVVFETVLIYVNRLHSDVFTTLNTSLGHLQAESGGELEKAVIEALDIKSEALAEGFGQEAMSVTTTALELATTMGCNPIILAGVDLAYTGNARYLPGVIEGTGFDLESDKQEMRCSEKLVLAEDIWKNPIYTLSKWEMESEGIAKFAEHNKQTTYLNATQGGIGVKGVKNIDLEKILFENSWDIEGMLDVSRECLIKDVGNKKALEALKKQWHASFLEGEELCKKALERLDVLGDKLCEEDGRLVYLDFIFQDLEMYKVFFKQSDQAFKDSIALRSSYTRFEETLLHAESIKKEALYQFWQSRLHVVQFLAESF